MPQQDPSMQMPAATAAMLPGGPPPTGPGMSPAAPAGGAPTDPKLMQMQIGESMKANPEVLVRLRAGIEAGLASGELTNEELGMAIQLARLAAQDPSMYPQLKAIAEQNGLAEPGDLPEEYDQGLVVGLLSLAQATAADIKMSNYAGQQQPQAPAGGGVKLSMASGGAVDDELEKLTAGGELPKRKRPDAYDATLHSGEYVVPDSVVRFYGTDKFDKMAITATEKHKEKMGLQVTAAPTTARAGGGGKGDGVSPGLTGVGPATATGMVGVTDHSFPVSRRDGGVSFGGDSTPGANATGPNAAKGTGPGNKGFGRGGGNSGNGPGGHGPGHAGPGGQQR